MLDPDALLPVHPAKVFFMNVWNAGVGFLPEIFLLAVVCLFYFSLFQVLRINEIRSKILFGVIFTLLSVPIVFGLSLSLRQLYPFVHHALSFGVGLLLLTGFVVFLQHFGQLQKKKDKERPSFPTLFQALKASRLMPVFAVVILFSYSLIWNAIQNDDRWPHDVERYMSRFTYDPSYFRELGGSVLKPRDFQATKPLQ